MDATLHRFQHEPASNRDRFVHDRFLQIADKLFVVSQTKGGQTTNTQTDKQAMDEQQTHRQSDALYLLVGRKEAN